jgi:hypothetical protein
MRWIWTAICSAVLWCPAAGHAAGALRCDGKIIDEGEPLGYVLGLCGRPSSHVISEVPVRGRNFRGFTYRSGVAVTEQLIYDRSWGQFPVLLEFRDGRLLRIEYLPRK